MKNCVLKTDLNVAARYEEEIKKIDPKILELKIARPALRALVNASIYTVKDLRSTTISELGALHGMGPAALKKLQVFYR